jgi:hypothetical protein
MGAADAAGNTPTGPSNMDPGTSGTVTLVPTLGSVTDATMYGTPVVDSTTDRLAA